MVELWVELEPRKAYTWKDLREAASRLLSCFDAIDIPDQPLGTHYSAPIISAAIARDFGGERAIAHIRTVDYTPNALKSIARSLTALGIRRLVLLRGDPLGSGIGVTPEGGLELLRSYKVKYGVNLGLILSLRKPLEAIAERLSYSPDFALILNLTRENIEKLERVKSLGNAKLYPYLVVAPPNSSPPGKVTSAMLSVKEALDLAVEIVERGLAEGLVVSVPGDDDLKLQLCRGLRRELSLG